MVKCPNCNSDSTVKKGIRAGRQRYRCSACGANFTEGRIYKKQDKYNKVTNLTCPKCNSTNIMRDGKLESGGQRYVCKDCKKQFSDKTNRNIKPIKYNCPYCNGKLTYSGYGKLGQREYNCTNCGKSCSADKRGKPIKRLTFEEQNTKILCPSCGSLRIKSAGIRDNIRRYICKECGKSFTEFSGPEPKYTQHSPEIIKEAVTDVLIGKPVNITAVKYGYNIRTLQNIVRPYYKKEQITHREKESILRLGMCGVPPEEIAPHFKCSIFNVKKLLRNYVNKRKVHKQNKITEQDKTIDRFELNRFIT